MVHWMKLKEYPVLKTNYSEQLKFWFTVSGYIKCSIGMHITENLGTLTIQGHGGRRLCSRCRGHTCEQMYNQSQFTCTYLGICSHSIKHEIRMPELFWHVAYSDTTVHPMYFHLLEEDDIQLAI